jgi:formylglycine-generating enzyme required for sulfatase activity
MGEPGESAWSPDRVVEVSDFDMDAELVNHSSFMAFMNKLDTAGVLSVTNDAVTLNDSSRAWNGYLLYKKDQISGFDTYDSGATAGQRFLIGDNKQQLTPVQYVTYFGAEMYAKDQNRDLPTDAEWVRAA